MTLFQYFLILGRLIVWKMANFDQILELEKPIPDLSWKKPSKWPGGHIFHIPMMKFGMWTTNMLKIHAITKKRSKNWTSVTYLNFVDFSSRAWESKFWVKKKFVRPAFNCPTYAKKAQEILPKNIDSPRHKSNFSLEGQNTEISQK